MSIRTLFAVVLLSVAPNLTVFAGQNVPTNVGDQRAPVASEGSKKGSTEHWKNYEAQGVKSATRGMSSIVVLRPVDAVAGEAINVYVNGEYLSSLRPGSFTQTAVCPGENRISVAESNVRNRYLEKSEAGLATTQQVDFVNFYLIEANGSALVAAPIDQASAFQLLSKMPLKQKHTISRVSTRSCSLK